jgi:hypothetical protein
MDPKYFATTHAMRRGTILQVVRSRVRFPMTSFNVFNSPNPFYRTTPRESAEILPEISTSGLSGSNRPSALKIGSGLQPCFRAYII